jgi:hypothetical protein
MLPKYHTHTLSEAQGTKEPYTLDTRSVPHIPGVPDARYLWHTLDTVVKTQRTMSLCDKCVSCDCVSVYMCITKIDYLQRISFIDAQAEMDAP